MRNKVTFEEAIEISINLNHLFKDLHYPENISPYDVRALWFLQKSRTNKINEIKEGILKKHKNLDKQKLNVRISKIIKHLETASLIERNKDKNDKRETIINITNKGNKLLKDITTQAKKIWKENYE